MTSNDSMKDTIELLRQQWAKQLEELRKTETTIRHLERMSGEAESQFDSDVQTTASSEQPEKSSQIQSAPQRRTEIQADEFFGLSQPEAARRYLKKIGHALPVEDVLESLRRGGCEVGGADPKKVLYISMVRDTRNFVKLPNGMVGLRDFYGDRNLNKASLDKRQKKKKKKSRHATRQAEKDETKTAE